MSRRVSPYGIAHATLTPDNGWGKLYSIPQMRINRANSCCTKAQVSHSCGSRGSGRRRRCSKAHPLEPLLASALVLEGSNAATARANSPVNNRCDLMTALLGAI